MSTLKLLFVVHEDLFIWAGRLLSAKHCKHFSSSCLIKSMALFQ